jgi:hypothetical protein
MRLVLSPIVVAALFSTLTTHMPAHMAKIQFAGARPLRDGKRVEFYPAGAAQALALDAVRPEWRLRYLAGPLSLDAPVVVRRRVDSRTTLPRNT